MQPTSLAGVYRRSKRGALYYVIDLVSMFGDSDYAYILLLDEKMGELSVMPLEKFRQTDTDGKPYFQLAGLEEQDKLLLKFRRFGVTLPPEDFGALCRKIREQQQAIASLQEQLKELGLTGHDDD